MRRSLPTLGDVIIYLGILLILFGPKPLALGQAPDRVSYQDVQLGAPPDKDAFKNGWVFVSPNLAHVAYWGGGRGNPSPSGRGGKRCGAPVACLPVPCPAALKTTR